jgi:hypothetical protein
LESSSFLNELNNGIAVPAIRQELRISRSEALIP